MNTSPVTTVKGRYSQLERLRDPYLRRGRDASKLTIPALLPPDGHNGSSDLKTPYQSLGARGVNNLASKLLLALLPPNSPFFRLSIDDFTLEKLTQQKGMRAEVEKALGSIERSVMNEIESTNIRVTVFETLKHLITTGNGLLYLPPTGGSRFFRLDRYVTQRDPSGNVLEIITREVLSPLALDPSIREACKCSDKESLEKTVELYTYIKRAQTAWEVRQEINDTTVPGSEGTYPLLKSPWIPLRFIAVEGEDYGRGYVEEYIGDLKSLEVLSKAIVQGAAAAAKVLFLVKPNGTTKQKVLAESESGDIREGNAEDVSVLQLEKFNDFRVALDTIRDLTERLSYAFMLNSAIQRNGERVTAEEIRFMAGELEDALGGVYSTMSQEFQLPLVRRLLHQMERQQRLPSLPDGVVKPTIVTGLEALGRGHDLSKLNTFLAQLQPLGPETLMQFMNIGDYISRVGTSLGIDMEGLIKSPEQVAQEQQQQMMMQMAQQAGPGMLQEMTKGAMQNPQGMMDVASQVAGQVQQ